MQRWRRQTRPAQIPTKCCVWKSIAVERRRRRRRRQLRWTLWPPTLRRRTSGGTVLPLQGFDIVLLQVLGTGTGNALLPTLRATEGTPYGDSGSCCSPLRRPSRLRALFCLGVELEGFPRRFLHLRSPCAVGHRLDIHRSVLVRFMLGKGRWRQALSKILWTIDITSWLSRTFFFSLSCTLFRAGEEIKSCTSTHTRTNIETFSFSPHPSTVFLNPFRRLCFCQSALEVNDGGRREWPVRD